MTTGPAMLKASVKIVPASLLAVMVYREVANSPVTMQTVATAFAGVCGLWLVGVVISSRDATRELKEAINNPEHGILSHIKAIADMVQKHEEILGEFYSKRNPTKRRRNDV